MLRSSLVDPMIASLAGSGKTGQSAGLGGLDSGAMASAFLMMSMAMMLEKFLSLQTQNAYQDEAAPAQAEEAYASGPQEAARSGAFAVRADDVLHHINQFDAAIQAGADGANADCGPTSLVMALHQLGLRVAGETGDTSDGEAINLARLSMTTNRSKDGVDALGNYADAEHNTFTDFNDLARGAAAAGAAGQRITPSADSIRRALESGKVVIASGTFAGKYPPPWTGDRGPDNQSAPGNARAHLIEISSFDPGTRQFTVHDPARRTPIRVDASALESFLSGNAGALALEASS